MKIDPKLIVEFSIISEEASFTKAAARLRVAQPWLSTRLRKLEKIVGFDLFVRSTRTVELTLRGEKLLSAARTLALAAETFESQVKQLQSSPDYRLRIGAPPYTKSMIERKLMIDGFVAQFPSVNFELQTGWSLGLQEQLRGYELDLAIVLGEYDDSIYDGLLLRKFGLAITVSRHHILADKRSVNPSQLSGHDVQVFTRSLNPKLWDSFYAPLVTATVNLVERPEVAEAGLDHLGPNDPPEAFIDFGRNQLFGSVVQIPIITNAYAPVYLLRRRNDAAEMVASFWNIASNSLG